MKYESFLVWNPSPEPYDPPLKKDRPFYVWLAILIAFCPLIPALYLFYDTTTNGHGFGYREASGPSRRILGPN